MAEEENVAFMDMEKEFGNIEQSIRGTIAQIENAVQNISELDGDKQVVMSAIHGISAITQQSAAAAEEVSASVDEQSSTISNISKMAVQLMEMSEELKKVIEKFKTE